LAVAKLMVAFFLAADCCREEAASGLVTVGLTEQECWLAPFDDEKWNRARKKCLKIVII